MGLVDSSSFCTVEATRYRSVLRLLDEVATSQSLFDVLPFTGKAGQAATAVTFWMRRLKSKAQEATARSEPIGAHNMILRPWRRNQHEITSQQAFGDGWPGLDGVAHGPGES
jgi:hypothetical protein